MQHPQAKPDSWLRLQRSVRFGDTDAAGVMHFHQLLRWCHEAYEESLECFGISAAELFPRPPGLGSAAPPDLALPSTALPSGALPSTAFPAVALPIVHCSADYRRPLGCGDRLSIRLDPRRLDPGSFEVTYRFEHQGEAVARGLTRHLAIEASSRQRCPLPEPIQRWLEASSLAGGVRPL
jgi:1,4-dihydroxy-2-naphthoyl-CoA hydrolase